MLVSIQRSWVMSPTRFLRAKVLAQHALLPQHTQKTDNTTADTKSKRITQTGGRNCNPAKEIELRSSNDASMSPAYHELGTFILKNVRSSTRPSVSIFWCCLLPRLSSSCTRSVDHCDFLGYEKEEDTEDLITSYTTPDLYGSAELLRT